MRGKERIVKKKQPKAKGKAFKLVEFALEKKAKEPLILDVRGVSSFCDYFIICSGDSSRQVQAIYEGILKRCKEAGYFIHHCEDDELKRWTLMDLSDIIIHIFLDEARKFYNLEHIWNEAKIVPLPSSLTT